MEETKVQKAVEEIRGADEESIRGIVEKWFESTRTMGMKIGAQYISVVIFDVIKKHTKKAGKVSLNDYRRMTEDIIKIISVQITRQNDSEENVTEEVANDE